MKLLLVRHATAVPRGTPGVSDDERPLTPEGEAEFRVAARGLARIARRPNVLLTSPLPRARVTAEIAARAFKHVNPRLEPALAHESVDGVLAALKTHPPGATVALVGHEPVLSGVLARASRLLDLGPIGILPVTLLACSSGNSRKARRCGTKGGASQ